MKRLLSPVCWAGLCALVLAVPLRAQAGGLYLTDRGARQLGRGGAFVAGADDGQSLWYNPAGLAYTGSHQLHIDGTLAFFQGSFQRVTRDDVNGPSPKVEVETPLLPIPTIAYSSDFGLDDWSFGVALMAPNAVMLKWPERVDGRPAPNRHSLISMEGSAIGSLAIGAAYRGIKGLSVGLGGHLVVSRFRASVFLSSCTYGVGCEQPEQPDYESPVTIDLEQAITATASAGLIYEWDMFRFGASVMLGYTMEGEAKLDVELPSAPLFGPADCGDLASREMRRECAKLRGDKADVALDFPMIVRVGAEVRPTEGLRIEADLVYEQWSSQDELSVSPKNMRIVDALNIEQYDVAPFAVRRDMQDVFSLRLGGEYAPLDDVPLVTRLGFIVENNAFDDRTLTPLTLDSDKLLVGLGASYTVSEGVIVDVMYAHMFMKDRSVRTSEIVPQNPLRPPPGAADPSDPQPELGQPEPIGNGDYTMAADLIGLGLRWSI